MAWVADAAVAGALAAAMIVSPAQAISARVALAVQAAPVGAAGVDSAAAVGLAVPMILGRAAPEGLDQEDLAGEADHPQRMSNRPH